MGESRAETAIAPSIQHSCQRLASRAARPHCFRLLCMCVSCYVAQHGEPRSAEGRPSRSGGRLSGAGAGRRPAGSRRSWLGARGPAIANHARGQHDAAQCARSVPHQRGWRGWDRHRERPGVAASDPGARVSRRHRLRAQPHASCADLYCERGRPPVFSLQLQHPATRTLTCARLSTCALTSGCGVVRRAGVRLAQANGVLQMHSETGERGYRLLSDSSVRHLDGAACDEAHRRCRAGAQARSEAVKEEDHTIVQGTSTSTSCAIVNHTSPH